LVFRILLMKFYWIWVILAFFENLYKIFFKFDFYEFLMKENKLSSKNFFFSPDIWSANLLWIEWLYHSLNALDRFNDELANNYLRALIFIRVVLSSSKNGAMAMLARLLNYSKNCKIFLHLRASFIFSD